jgi:TatD DNase family protein
VRLVDSHCHLQADRFDADRDAVIEQATATGVERILVPGWDGPSNEAALELVVRHPWLDAAVGIHPHDAAHASEGDWRAVVAAARDPRVVAIGETGLDHDRVFSPVGIQLANLRRHLDLTIEVAKPAILHCRSKLGERDAQDTLVAALLAAGIGGPRAAAAFGERPAAIIHSFSGPVDYARRVLDLGLAISFSGLAFRAGEEATREVANLVPANRLLVETDSPFLSPPGAPRRRNAPEFVAVTSAAVAGWRGEAANAAAFGDRLIAAYDRTFPRSRGGLTGFRRPS